MSAVNVEINKRPVLPAGNRQPIHGDPLPAVSYINDSLAPKPSPNRILTVALTLTFNKAFSASEMT